MKTIIQHCFKGQKALIRVDFNVPVNLEMQITDDTRMRAVLPTINKVLNDGGSVILMSHRGRPKNGQDDQFSLKYLVDHLGKLLDKKVDFVADCIGSEAKEKAASLVDGSVLLLENLRFYNQEEVGDLSFAKSLAELADVYVNDAFGTAHRAHASTSVIAQFFPEKSFLDTS